MSFSKHVSIAGIVASIMVGTALEAGSAAAVAATTSTATGKTMYSVTNVRSGPSTSTASVGTVPAGTSFSGVVSNGWMHITAGKYAGKYVGLSTLQLNSSSAPTSTASPSVITVSTLYSPTNIRTAASLSASIATHVNAGTTMTGTLSNGWLHITSPSALAGKYVSYSVVKLMPTPASKPGSTSTTPPAKTSSASPVYTLNSPFTCTSNPANPTADCAQAVQYVLNSWMIRTNASGVNLLTVSGSFDTATISDVKVFQSANGLRASGSLDAPTWKALSQASTATNTTLSTGISGAAGDTHPAFPNAIKLKDGRLMLVFTSAKQHLGNTAPATTWKTYSSDGGYSWTKPQQIVLPNGYENTPAGLGIATSGPLAGRPILTTWSVDSYGNHHTEVIISSDLAGDGWGAPVDLNTAFGHQTLSASPIVQVDDTNFQQAVYVATAPINGSPEYAATVGLTYDGTQFVVGTPAVIAAVKQGATPASTSTVALTPASSSGATSNSVSTTPAASSTSVKTPANTTRAVSASPTPPTLPNSVSTTTGSFSEVGMIKLKDGRLFALVRNDPDKSSGVIPGIYASYSSDGGKTWSLPVFAFYGSGAPRVGMTSDGKLVVLYRHATEVNQPSGEEDAVYRVSSDSGASWGAEQLVGVHSKAEMVYGTPVGNADGTVTFIYGSETSGSQSNMVTTPNVSVKN